MKNTEAQKVPLTEKEGLAPMSAEQPETKVEKVVAAETVETMGPDGKKLKLVQIEGDLVAHKGGDGTVRVGEMSAESAQVGMEVGKTFDALSRDSGQILDSIINTAGLGPDEAKNIREAVQGELFDLISGAALVDNHSNALAGTLREVVNREAQNHGVEIPKEVAPMSPEAAVAMKQAELQKLYQEKSIPKSKLKDLIRRAKKELAIAQRASLEHAKAQQETATNAELSAMSDIALGLVPATEAFSRVQENPKDAESRLQKIRTQSTELQSRIAKLENEVGAPTKKKHKDSKIEKERAQKRKEIEGLYDELVGLEDEAKLLDAGLDLVKSQQGLENLIAEATRIAEEEKAKAALPTQENKDKKAQKRKELFKSKEREKHFANAIIDANQALTRLEQTAARLEVEYKKAEQNTTDAKSENAKSEILANFLKTEEALKAQVERVQKLREKLIETTEQTKAIQKSGVDFSVVAPKPEETDLYKKLDARMQANPDATLDLISRMTANEALSPETKKVYEAFRKENLPTPVPEATESAFVPEAELEDLPELAIEPLPVPETSVQKTKAVPAEDLDDQFWAERRAGKDKAAAEGRTWTAEDAQKLAKEAQVRTAAKRADEPPPIPEDGYAREMDTVTPTDVVGARTQPQEASQRRVEMPVVTPDMLTKRDEIVQEEPDAEPRAEEPIREPVRINYDRFPTQQLEPATRNDFLSSNPYADQMRSNEAFAQQIDAIASETSTIDLARDIGDPMHTAETIAFNKAIFNGLSVENRLSNGLPATWEEVVKPKIGFINRLFGGKNRTRKALLDKINNLQGQFVATGKEGAVIVSGAAETAKARSAADAAKEKPKGLV